MVCQEWENQFDPKILKREFESISFRDLSSPAHLPISILEIISIKIFSNVFRGLLNIDTGKFTYEIPEKPEISGISEIGGNNLGEPLFDDIGKERMASLKSSISELNTLIKEREKLSKEIVKEAEVLKTEINNFLLENENIELEDHDAMIERTNLRRERRVYEQELSEKENRVKALNKILEES